VLLRQTINTLRYWQQNDVIPDKNKIKNEKMSEIITLKQTNCHNHSRSNKKNKMAFDLIIELKNF
jgi:hypothetical protein